MTLATNIETSKFIPTFTRLVSKEGGTSYPLKALNICEETFAPLEVDYDYDLIRRTVTRESIQAGPNSIWRYRSFLPVESENPIDVGTGMTPLVKSHRLARRLGLKNLYIKNDAVDMVGTASHHLFVDEAGFYVVLVGHFKSILYQFIKIGAAINRVVGAVNFGVQSRYEEVKPAIAYGFFVKKTGIVFNDRVFGHLKSEIAIIFPKRYIRFFRVNDFGVGTWLGRFDGFLAAETKHAAH
jgi:hypothetical protein